MAIGDQWNRDNGYNSGQVQVYSWSVSEWKQLLGDINGEAKLDYFGQSTALSRLGNRVAVGAPGNSGGYSGVYEMVYDESPEPPVDPMKVYLLKPDNVRAIPQNHPATGCAHHPQAGYGLRVDFDWSDAQSPAGFEATTFMPRGDAPPCQSLILL